LAEREAVLADVAEQWPLWRCVRLGLAIGAAYAVLQGIASQGSADFEAEYGLALGQAVLLDLVGGSVGGTAVGLLLPRVRGLLGAVVLGQAGVAPVVTMFALADEGPVAQQLIDGVIAGVLIGTLAGCAIWVRLKNSPVR
jgi:hypothetical protein